MKDSRQQGRFRLLMFKEICDAVGAKRVYKWETFANGVITKDKAKLVTTAFSEQEADFYRPFYAICRVHQVGCRGSLQSLTDV